MTTPRIISVFIVGSNGSGKTSLIRRVTENTFLSDCNPGSIRKGSATTTVVTDEGEEIQLHFADEDHPNYHCINVYRVYHTFIVLYDISDQLSLQYIQRYYDRIHEHHKLELTVLVGNKCDMERAVSPADVKHFTYKGGIPHIEISAKTSTNIKEMMMLLIGLKLGKSVSGRWEPRTVSTDEHGNLSLQPKHIQTENEAEQYQSSSTSDSEQQNSSQQL